MNSRFWLLILSVFIVAVVVALASSLHDVRFQPGKPLSYDEPAAAPAIPEVDVAELVVKPPLWKVLLVWLAFVVNLLLFFWLLPPEVRKQILRQIVSLALGVLAIILALRYKLVHLPFLELPPVEQPNTGTSGANSNGPVPTFSPPPMTTWWVFMVSFIVLAALLVLLWFAYRWWMRQGQRRFADLDAIGSIARSSLNELAAGREWNDVIIQSNVRMNEAVGARRGLQRHRAATPREFAQRLEQAGLPARAVERLTRLFESARYGARASSQSDINEAVSCLNSILEACGQPL